MFFFGAIAVAICLIAASGYLQLRTLAVGVGAPKGCRELLDPQSYRQPWLEQLGFRTVGEFLFAGATKNDPPTVAPALVSPDSTTVGISRSTLDREFTLLTTWPDGAYVVTKCPPRGLITTRDSALFALRSASSAAEALSLHYAAIKAFERSHGLPMQARDTKTVAACCDTAAATWHSHFVRTYAVAVPLGLLGCVAVLLAALAG
jgi:predicted RNase H-like HicB family nuclease